MSNTSLSIAGQDTDGILKGAIEVINRDRAGRPYLEMVPENHEGRVLELANTNHHLYAVQFDHAKFTEMMALNWLIKVAMFRAICRKHGYNPLEEPVPDTDICNRLIMICLSKSASITWIGRNSMTEVGTKILYVPIPFRGKVVKEDRDDGMLAKPPAVGAAIEFARFGYKTVSETIEMYFKFTSPTSGSNEADSEVVTGETVEAFQKADLHTFSGSVSDLE